MQVRLGLCRGGMLPSVGLFSSHQSIFLDNVGYYGSIFVDPWHISWPRIRITLGWSVWSIYISDCRLTTRTDNYVKKPAYAFSTQDIGGTLTLFKSINSMVHEVNCTKENYNEYTQSNTLNVTGT